MRRKKLIISGNINRNCERCGKEEYCTCFETEGKNHIMCNNCLLDEYEEKTMKKEDTKEYSLCSECGLKTMAMNKDKTKINKDNVVQYFECLKCGKTEKRKIKKGKL